MKYFLLPFFALLASPALAQSGEDWEYEEGELVADTIRSNLPLYGFDWEDLWPRNFYSDDGFGCVTPVGFGDWKTTLFNPGEEDQEAWDRISNYGVFHCAANILSAEGRTGLSEGKFERGFFVRLAVTELDDVEWELWALQQGVLPGSQYILMAREAKQGSLVEKFHLLQQRCPKENVLESDNMDVWSTRYCLINSREELSALATEMLRLPMRGVMERMPDLEGTEEALDTEPDASSE